MHLFAQRTRHGRKAPLIDQQVEKRARNGPTGDARRNAEFSNAEHYLILDNLNEFRIWPKSRRHVYVARPGRHVMGEYVLL